MRIDVSLLAIPGEGDFENSTELTLPERTDCSPVSLINTSRKPALRNSIAQERGSTSGRAIVERQQRKKFGAP